MAITSKLRLNQMAEGLALMDGSLENMLDTANAGYVADVVPVHAQGTMEETLQTLAKSMQRRFGTTSAGAFNETFGAANSIGELANFSINDAASITVNNRADKQIELTLGNSSDSALLMNRESGTATERSVILKSGADEQLLLDELNDFVELKASADNFLKIDDAAANEITVLQHSSIHQLSLDQASGVSRMKADGSILDMSKGLATGEGVIDLQTDASNFLKIDGTSGSELVNLAAKKDMIVDWAAGEEWILRAGGAAGDYVQKIDDDNTVTHTDVFGATNVPGRYSQIVAPTYAYEKDILTEKVETQQQLDYQFSVDTSADFRSRIMAGLLASANADKVRDVDENETAHGVGIQIAADRLNGDQHLALAAHSQESGLGLADASFSKYALGINSILQDTVGIYSADSQGTKLHATRGSAVASIPASYGGSNPLSGLSLGEANHIWLRDSHCDVGNGASQWSETKGIPLSIATEEWVNYEATFGEVSLLNAVVSAASGGTTDAGFYVIGINATVNAGDLLIGESTNVPADSVESDNARFVAFDFNSKDTSPQVDRSQAANKISEIPSAGLDSDEILAAVRVFVNGQLMMGDLSSATPVGQPVDYHICDHDMDSATAYGGSAFSIKFSFPLEAGDIVQIFVG